MEARKPRSLTFLPYEETEQQLRRYGSANQSKVIKEAIHRAILSLRKHPKPIATQSEKPLSKGNPVSTTLYREDYDWVFSHRQGESLSHDLRELLALSMSPRADNALSMQDQITGMAATIQELMVINQKLAGTIQEMAVTNQAHVMLTQSVAELSLRLTSRSILTVEMVSETITDAQKKSAFRNANILIAKTFSGIASEEPSTWLKTRIETAITQLKESNG